jgi:ketosteroid isomerase-like protein
MSQENVEIVRRGGEAWVERGPDAFYDGWFAEDCVVEDFPELPDGGVYRGRDGLRERLSNFRSSWGDDLVLSPVEYIDGGGDMVIAVLGMVGHGDGSGVPLDAEAFFVLELRDGLIVRDRPFTSRSQALQAAGLAE